MASGRTRPCTMAPLQLAVCSKTSARHTVGLMQSCQSTSGCKVVFLHKKFISSCQCLCQKTGGPSLGHQLGHPCSAVHWQASSVSGCCPAVLAGLHHGLKGPAPRLHHPPGACSLGDAPSIVTNQALEFKAELEKVLCRLLDWSMKPVTLGIHKKFEQSVPPNSTLCPAVPA